MNLVGHCREGGVSELLEALMSSGGSAVLEVHSEGRAFWLGVVRGAPVRFARSEPELSAEQIPRDAQLDAHGEPQPGDACIRSGMVELISELSALESGSFTLDLFSDPRAEWPGPEGLTLDPPSSREADTAAKDAVRATRESEADALQTHAVTAFGEGGTTKLMGGFEEGGVSELLEALMTAGCTAVLELQSEERAFWLGLEDGALLCLACSEPELSAEQILHDAQLDACAEPDRADACIRKKMVELVAELAGLESGRLTLDLFANPRTEWPAREGLSLSSPISEGALTLELALLEDERARSRPSLQPGAEVDGAPSAAATSAAGTPAEDPPAAEKAARTFPAAIIAFDSDPELLDRVKGALEPYPVRLHRFQLLEDTLFRFKQYLILGRHPVVILGVSDGGEMAADQDAAWRQAADRILRMSPRVQLVLLAPSGFPGYRGRAQVLARPESDADEAFARELAGALRLD